MTVIQEYKKAINSFINDIVIQIENKDGINSTLYQAMQYVLNSGGKRIRSSILMHIADMLGADFDSAIVSAVALELIHNYTLVHDDLPGMDDDKFRRGLPACHEKFNEGIAILTGNALFSLSLQVLMDGLKGKEDILFKVMQVLIASSGYYGILSGQATDLEMKQNNKNTIIGLSSEDSIMDVLNMFYFKTGKLFEAAFVIPGILAKLSSEKCQILAECGGIVGVLYQVTDDIKDSDSNNEITKNIKNSLLENFETCIKQLENDVDKSKIEVLRQIIAEI